MNKLKDAIDYFINEAGYSRLFQKFAAKIESIGHIGGSITISNLTDNEKRVLRNWFGRDYSKKNSATVSLKKFEKQMEDTKFQGVDFYKVVEGVVGGPILYKKDMKQLEEEAKNDFFLHLTNQYQSQNTNWLTEAILNKEPAAIGFVQSYNQKDYQSIELIYKTVMKLPLKTKVRLPVLAERIAGDPHYFDKDTKFVTALQIIKSKRVNTPYINDTSAEVVNELLFEYGILKDDLQNFVTCSGLIAVKNGENVRSWDCLYDENSVHNVPLRELVKYDRVLPKKGDCVFVVENSGVFSSILDLHNGEPLPFVCTHGQFKLAALQLIEKLCNENVTIYYAGDYDPEGLQMAQRLRMKYGQSIHFWRYTIQDYIEALSEKVISPLSASKLDNIKEPELLDIKNEMKKLKTVGYQERHIETLYKDIISMQ